VKVLVVSPTYNVEETIETHISRLLVYIDREDILFIDDGSTDQTVAIIAEYNIKCIPLQRNWGKGFALMQGLRYAKEHHYDAVITIDSDLQHSHDFIPDLINCYRSHIDIVIGVRSQNYEAMPFSRKISNACSSFIISVLARKRIKDSQSGFRMIGSDYFDLVSLEYGFTFESDFLVKACWRGASVLNIKIPTIYNGSKSSFRYVRDTLLFVRLFTSLTAQMIFRYGLR